MGTNDGGIDKMHVPVELVVRVGLLLDGSQETVPDPRDAPAIEAAGDGARGTVAVGQIAPRSTGTQDPQDAVDDTPMLDVRAAGFRFLGRQQRLQLGPLFVG